MAYLSLPLIIFSTFVLSWILASIFRTKNKKLAPPPPKAKGAWPIIGHLHTKLDHHKLGAMADEYGPIFTVQLGLTPAVVVSSSEWAKEVYTNHDLVISSRPKFIALDYFGYNNSIFGFTAYGAYWRDMRKVATVHLLSNTKLEKFKHVRWLEVQESIKDLYKIWVQEVGKEKSGWAPVEMKECLMGLAYNLIVRMVAGKKYCGSITEMSEEAKHCQAALRKFFDILGTFVVADFLPFLRWLDSGGHEKVMKKESKELDVIVQKWLDEHRMEQKKLGGQEKEEEDFMDVLLKLLDGQDIHGFDSDTVIKATSLGMVVAGADTVSVTVLWAISLLLNNRKSLKKAQDELDKHIGRDRHVEESDLNDLPYLKAIVKETLRLYPPGPLSGPRQFDEDCVVNGYHISKGSRLITNVYKIQRNPKVWDDPLAFQPERFLTTHKDIDIKARNFDIMPFGTGRRVCAGTSLGLSSVELSLASLLHSFDFSTPNNEPVDMEESFGLTVIKTKPLDVLLAPRLPAHLYE